MAGRSAPAGSPEFPDPPQRRKPSTAKLRRLQAVLLSLRPLRFSDLVSSQRQPNVGEQAVIVRSADAGAAELFVPGILEPYPCVEPRPAWRETADKWDIGDLSDPAARARI